MAAEITVGITQFSLVLLQLHVLLILSLVSQSVYSRAIPCDGPGITCNFPVACPGIIELTQDDGAVIM